MNSSFFLHKKSVLLPESWTYAECCTLKKQKNKTSRTKTGFTQLCYSFTLLLYRPKNQKSTKNNCQKSRPSFVLQVKATLLKGAETPK